MGDGLNINVYEYSVLLTYMYFWMSGGGFTTGTPMAKGGGHHLPNVPGLKNFDFNFFLKTNNLLIILIIFKKIRFFF
jgi:hypothetical protein